PGSAAIDILCRLADAGAPEGTVVLSATARTRLGAAALFRPHLAIGGAPLFSTIATLALAEALEADGLAVTPVWPDRVTIDGETAGRGMVESALPAERPTYVILGADIDVQALETARRQPIDWNLVVGELLNALDEWTTAYAARDPAAVRAAIRFLPRGPAPSAANRG
ncbi:MAG: biotin/lipoate--protein ligase family protein, partial [Candidatus Rokuibacteriota bacterium]